jgi:hypothetical protein
MEDQAQAREDTIVFAEMGRELAIDGFTAACEFGVFALKPLSEGLRAVIEREDER